MSSAPTAPSSQPAQSAPANATAANNSSSVPPSSIAMPSMPGGLPGLVTPHPVPEQPAVTSAVLVPDHAASTAPMQTRIDTPAQPSAPAAHPPETTVTTISLERPASPSPTPQSHPSSIPIPPPMPTTTIVLNAPPTPDHITAPPLVTPVLAVVEVPHTSSAEVPPTQLKAVPPTLGTSHSPSETTTKPVQRVDTLADLPAHTTPRSRRNSSDETSSSGPSKTKPSNLPLPARPSYNRAASSGDLRSGAPSPNIPKGAVGVLVASVHFSEHHTASHEHGDPLSLLTLRAGKGAKPFQINRQLLTAKVPYFNEILAHDTAPGTGRLSFEDLDEYGFALFVRWLYGGELHGPKDFHSFQHYLSLYVLALRFELEELQNTTMDLTRAYYRQNSMTAPAYRIEYVYTYTSTPNHMRNFLTTTAAYRCLCEAPAAPGLYLSDSMRGLIGKGGDVSTDFAESVIKLSKNGLVDVRRGSDCVFHVHGDGKVCEVQGMEPYENV